MDCLSPSMTREQNAANSLNSVSMISNNNKFHTTQPSRNPRVTLGTIEQCYRGGMAIQPLSLIA